MKKLLLLSMALLSLTASAQEWRELFNGKNLKGWEQKNGKASFTVKDGCIVGTTTMKTDQNSFLCTKEHFSDFILEFEFLVDPALNSGVQFRSHSTKDYQNYRVHGYQFEIDPSKRAWTGGIYDEAGRMWLYPLTKNPQAQSAYYYGWNRARIEACGNVIRTYVNSIPCANLWDDGDNEGFIALQVHAIYDAANEGKQIKWRNIRILTSDVEKFMTRESNERKFAPEVNAIDNSLSPQEEKEGWQLLFDGKTTNGWRGAKLDAFPKNGWEVKDGVLRVMPGNGGESQNGGDIVTVQPYESNFILTVDFKITEGANSGIKYFVDPELNKGEGSAIGCEFQILDDERHPDAKLGVNGNRTLGSLYDLIPAPTDKPFKKGEWNTAMIIVMGNHVEHWLNGTRLLTYERNNQQWNALVAYSKYKNWPNFGNRREGNILLQDHGDEVFFKKIKIRKTEFGGRKGGERRRQPRR